MDIEDEWENFLVSDENTREELEDKHSDIGCEIPKCSPIYISTKTNIAYFNTTIDLKDIFWKIDVLDYYDNKNGIIKKQMKFNSLSKEEHSEIEDYYNKESKFKTCDVISHIDTTSSKKDVYKDVRKISIGIAKKDILSYRTKKKSAFYNCFVIIVRLWCDKDNIFKEVHVKIFNTGKVEIPGIQDDDIFYQCIEYTKKMLSKYYYDIDYSKNEIETVLINSNFSCGYLIKREKLFDILVNKYKIQSLYDPCSYPGVQSKYMIDIENNHDDKDKNSNKKIELSFMIFRTGSVLIVGKCDKEHLLQVYNFLKDIFKNEYQNICQYDNNNEESNKVKTKRQPKQRKKMITRSI